MTDIYKAPYLTYVVPTGIIVQASQDQVIVAINVLKAALTPSASAPAVLPSPHFSRIAPAIAALIVAELNGIIVAVDAAPIA